MPYISEEILFLISDYNPYNFRSLNKNFRERNENIVRSLYEEKFKEIEKAKEYLNSLFIKPNIYAMNNLFEYLYKRKSICGFPTKRGCKCKNKVIGNKRCYIHKNKIITNMSTEHRREISHLSLPNCLRYKIDRSDGNPYNYREFVEYYGGNTEWYESELCDESLLVTDIWYTNTSYSYD